MKWIYAFCSALFLLSAPALALDLKEARANGLLGEAQTGYVVALSGGADEEKLAQEINMARRAEYQKISSENGQPVDVVAGIAATKIISKLPKGAKYQAPGGSWMTK